MKHLIFDAGPIISLSMNGLLGVLEELKKDFNGKFIITPQVKNEVIDKPMKIKKYKLEAIKVKHLLDKNILEISDNFIPRNELEKETKRIMKIFNGTLRFSKTHEKINIIQDGEASCIAFANLCKCKSLLVIDERSTRLLIESPKNLKKLIERKVHSKIDTELNLVKNFNNLKFIRSSELLIIAYKRNLFPFKKDKQLLEALLYAVKFSGTPISTKEIIEAKKLV